MGGIGYFHGSSIVDDSFAQEWDDEDEYEGGRGKSADPRLTEPRELFTATPSRSFFPRGFYWYAQRELWLVLTGARDEGFHLRVIGAWDNDLSLEILKSWIDLIDENGWVAREQILGEEARSRVRVAVSDPRADESRFLPSSRPSIRATPTRRRWRWQ